MGVGGDDMSGNTGTGDGADFDVNSLKNKDIIKFMFGKGWEIGINPSEFVVDLEYFRVQFQAEIAEHYGIAVEGVASLSAALILDYQFGGLSEVVDYDYIRATDAEQLTAFYQGVAIDQIADWQILDFVYSTGLPEQGLQVSVSSFDTEAYAEANQDALVEFYGVDKIAKLKDKDILKFAFGKGWKDGINPADFVGEGEVDAIKANKADKLAEFYGITVEEVANLSVSLVLDFQFGGLSKEVDYDFLRTTYATELTALYTDVSIEQITHVQILDFVYSQGLSEVEGFQLSPVDVDGYCLEHGKKLKDHFKVKTVKDIDKKDIKEFALGEGLDLGLDASSFVNFEYYRQTYSAALLNFHTEVTDVTAITDQQILDWFSANSVSVDINYTRFTYEAELISFYGVDSVEDLTDKQVVDFAFGGELPEDGKRCAIDINAYRQQYGDDMASFYKGTGGAKNTNKGTSSDDISGGTGAESITGGDMSGGTGGAKNSSNTGTETIVDGDISGDNPASDTITGGDDIPAADLSDAQIVKYIFGEGWKQGVNPLEFVDVAYLRQTQVTQLAEFYGVTVDEVANLDDDLVIDYQFGGLSQFVDYEYYRVKYSQELATDLQIDVKDVAKLSDKEILKHLYSKDFDPNFKLSGIDFAGYSAKYAKELAKEFDIDVKDVFKLDKHKVKDFMFGKGKHKGLKLSDFVDVDFYRQYQAGEITLNYRADNVYSVSSQNSLDFMLNEGLDQGLNPSPAVDLEWYRTTYAQALETDKQSIDIDANGNIDNSELFDYVTGAGLQQGNNPSAAVDIAEYRQLYASDLLTHYSAASIDEVSNQETLEYMLSGGLENGYKPSSKLQNFDDYKAAHADALIQQYGASSIEEVTYQETFEYMVGGGAESGIDPFLG
jgi:hypothetical protein